MNPHENRVEEGGASTLWIRGDRRPVNLIRISSSHVELMIDEGVVLEKEQLVALLPRSFLSLPLRVETVAGQHIVLRFVQPPHGSIIDLLRRDVLASGCDAAIETAEEKAKPGIRLDDLKVGCDEEDAVDLEQRAEAA